MTSCETVGSAKKDPSGVVSVMQFQRVTEAAQIMFHNRVGCLVVIADFDDDTMVGILSERDILKWISQASPEMYSQNVQEIMTKDIISCDVDVPLNEGWKIMKKNNIRHLPIVKNNRALEMLSVRDLLDGYDPSEFLTE